MPDGIRTTRFDQIVDRYELLIDWNKRLENEAPFFRKLFEERGVTRVADMACGTGHHAAMFASWGLDVTGMDISAAMIERSRELHGTSQRLNWECRSFLEAVDHREPFDAIVCLGNSLALVERPEDAAQAIRNMSSSLRPGGIGIIQLLNMAAIREGPMLVQKLRRVRQDGRSRLLVKGIHRRNKRAFVELIEIDEDREPVSWKADSAMMIQLNRPELERMIRDARGQVLAVLGSYAGDRYDELQSGDLIVNWWRPSCG